MRGVHGGGQNREDIYGEKRWRGQSRSKGDREGVPKAQGNCRRVRGAVAEQFSQGGGNCSHGMIGKSSMWKVGLPSGTMILPGQRADERDAPSGELDYETWIGPARMEPYIEGACI